MHFLSFSLTLAASWSLRISPRSPCVFWAFVALAFLAGSLPPASPWLLVALPLLHTASCCCLCLPLPASPLLFRGRFPLFLLPLCLSRCLLLSLRLCFFLSLPPNFSLSTSQFSLPTSPSPAPFVSASSWLLDTSEHASQRVLPRKLPQLLASLAEEPACASWGVFVNALSVCCLLS